MTEHEKWIKDTEAEIRKLEEENEKLDRVNRVLDWILQVLVRMIYVLAALNCFVCALTETQPMAIRACGLFSGMYMVLLVYGKTGKRRGMTDGEGEK